MAVDSRISTVQEFIHYYNRGDVAAAVEFLDEDVSFKVPGNHSLSGHFSGKDAVAKHLAEVFRVFTGTLDLIQWEDWMSGVTHVAAMAHMKAQRQGMVHEFRTVYVVAMSADNKIRQVQMFFDDLVAAERFLQ